MTYSNLGSSSLGAPYEPYVSYEKKEPVVNKSESFENFEGLEKNCLLYTSPSPRD